MIKGIFPEGTAIFRNKPHTPELFSLIIDEIDRASEPFTGMIKIEEEAAAYFLFFLTGDAYAAGHISEDKPMPLSIKDFFRYMSDSQEKKNVSLFKIDPVLFKGMLVYLQREPSVKAASDMIDIENILSQIKKDNASAFVVLKKKNMHNFFYVHSGEPMMAHFSDESGISKESTIAEQLKLYAYAGDKGAVEVLIYRDIKTFEASDKASIKPSMIPDIIPPEKKEPAALKPVLRPDAENKPLRVRIEITEGPQKGNKFNVPLPCTIGRRDADIRVRDMTISKRHASVEAIDGRIIFKDLGSTNGSMVNGKEVTEAELSDGDLIQMGNSAIKINFV